MRVALTLLALTACAGHVISSPGSDASTGATTRPGPDASIVDAPLVVVSPVPDATTTTTTGPLPACTFANLAAISMDWVAYRAALVCGNASGASFCPSNDGVACPAGSRLPPFQPCVDQCAPNEYALVPNPAPRFSFSDAAPTFAPAPAGCVPTIPAFLGPGPTQVPGQPSLECCPCL